MFRVVSLGGHVMYLIEALLDLTTMTCFGYSLGGHVMYLIEALLDLTTLTCFGYSLGCHIPE
jgi:hypothetical protein